MFAPLSDDERDALLRYLAQLLENTEKVASLLESRGLPADAARNAHRQLRSVQRQLRGEQVMEAGAGGTRNQPEMGYNHLS